MFSGAPPSVYQSSKCFVTYGKMGHVDMQQQPSKGKPWTSITAMDFIHKVDLLLPKTCLQLMRAKIMDYSLQPHFFRVTMTLRDVLIGEFYTEYIKKGNVLMLSEGKTAADSVFTLREGTLTMYLDKETFERAGLVGKPHGAKGARGAKPRWVVSYDLRSPTMLHGKKGFDRLVYACKQVLNHPVNWLFYNVAHSYPEPDPLSKYLPVRFDSTPGLTQNIEAGFASLIIPPSILASSDRPGLEEWASELYEWISLIRLGSPRIEVGDSVDPYLSRYSIPANESSDEPSKVGVCKLTWQGFIAPEWLRRLLMEVIIECPANSWFFMSATAFSKSLTGSGEETAFLRPPEANGEYLMWEIKSPE